MSSARRPGIIELPSAWTSFGEGHKERFAGFPVPAWSSRICSRHAIKPRPGLLGTERIAGHMGQQDRRRHVEEPDFEDDKVAETSTIQDRCALLKQIRSFPGAARAARPAHRPEAAGCRRVARTCGGGAESQLPSPPGQRGTRHDGLCPRPASMRTVFPYS